MWSRTYGNFWKKLLHKKFSESAKLSTPLRRTLSVISTRTVHHYTKTYLSCVTTYRNSSIFSNLKNLFLTNTSCIFNQNSISFTFVRDFLVNLNPKKLKFVLTNIYVISNGRSDLNNRMTHTSNSSPWNQSWNELQPQWITKLSFHKVALELPLPYYGRRWRDWYSWNWNVSSCGWVLQEMFHNPCF